MESPCGPVTGSSSSASLFQEPTDSAVAHKTRQKVMAEAARSKRGILWGPTHSVDSEDSSNMKQKQQQQVALDANDRTESTKEESGSSSSSPPVITRASNSPPSQKSALDRIYESATAVASSIVTPSPPYGKQSQGEDAVARARAEPSTDEEPHQAEETPDGQELFPFMNPTIMRRQTEALALMFQDACRKCNPEDGTYDNHVLTPERPYVGGVRSSETNLGISPMLPPGQDHYSSPLAETMDEPGARERSDVSDGTPASRRRQRHLERQQRLSSNAPLPLDTLEVEQDETVLQRSISELTMRSSYGEATAKLADTRRMAYYAVGKHHKNGSSKRAGNRRCYFTGKLILGGSPFYAGSVQQGLRTLVVFCLPSSLGLPEGIDASQMSKLKRETSVTSRMTNKSGKSQSSGVFIPRLLKKDLSFGIRKRTNSANSAVNSRLSSLISSSDGTGMSLDEDYDPNWDLDRDYLLQVLPDPSQKLLDTMAQMYPEQYQTLPVQVRSPNCWRLFIKFCFFSGLPIAEGEMYYKVRDEVANEVYGEEIILSHDVMEAVNGESADIVRLPNQKTFKYLKKHYSQQCGKLSDAVFLRESWEVVLPEI
jgi:hypothetical protein